MSDETRSVRDPGLEAFVESIETTLRFGFAGREKESSAVMSALSRSISSQMKPQAR